MTTVQDLLAPPTFELKHAPVRTIAHLFKASRQILDDAPALRSYIDRVDRRFWPGRKARTRVSDVPRGGLVDAYLYTGGGIWDRKAPIRGKVKRRSRAP